MAAGHLVWDRFLFLLLRVTICVVGAHSRELDPMLIFLGFCLLSATPKCRCRVQHFRSAERDLGASEWPRFFAACEVHARRASSHEISAVGSLKVS